MKMIINSAYQHLSVFVSSVPFLFEKEGTVVYNGRNLLKSFSVEGVDVIVKRFRVPIFINRVAYSFLRPSKARRSYEYAGLLLKKDIETPDPIAYIEERKAGLLRYSYYICVYEKGCSHIRDEMEGEKGGRYFQKQLAYFIAGLHEKGILHLDLSPGNVLYQVDDEEIRFLLIDINRMRFMREIPDMTRYRNFRRLSNKLEITTFMAQEYAKICLLDVKRTVKFINKFSMRFHKIKP